MLCAVLLRVRRLCDLEQARPVQSTGNVAKFVPEFYRYVPEQAEYQEKIKRIRPIERRILVSRAWDLMQW